MSGSPEYLALLHHFKFPTKTIPDKNNAWTELEEAWEWLMIAQNEKTLFRLADAALMVLEHELLQSRQTLLDAAAELHAGKNAGYAGHTSDPWSNFRLANRFDVSTVKGVYVRMSDKYSRIKSLRANPDNDRVSEPITDTLRDLFAYALIAICIIEEAINYE